MKQLNLEALLKIKEKVDAGELKQVCDVQDTTEVEVDYNERSSRNERYIRTKMYIEAHMHGVEVFLRGGEVKYQEPDNNYTDYKSLVITCFKIGDKNNYTEVKVDGCELYNNVYESNIYDSFIRQLFKGNVKQGYISTTEIYLEELIEDICLSEAGFMAEDNQLMLWKNGKVYNIISNIKDEVQGVMKITLPYERDESIIIFCKDKTIMLSDDNFYFDSENEVA